MCHRILALFILLAVLSAGNVFAWQKGPITDSVLTSLFVDMYLNYFKFHTEGRTWSETAQDYAGVSYSMPDGNEFYNPNCFSWPTCGHAIVLDGTDAQVAQTGLTREELARRVALKAQYDYHVTNFKTPLSRDSFNLQIDRARTVYAAARVAPTGFGLRPNDSAHKLISLSWNDRMDYANSLNWITTVFAPQDLADPRLIGGRSVKDWIKNYWWGSTGGDYNHPTPYIEPNFAPDFSFDHHNFLHNWYAFSSYAHADLLGKLLTQLKTKNNIEDNYTSSCSNLRDLMKYGAVTTAGNGWLLRMHSYNEHPPLKAYTNLSWASSVFKDPVCRALTARSIEEMSKRQPTYSQPYGTGWDQKDMQAAYLLTRLLGGADTALSYSQAVKRLHGTYWFRHYRYLIHRTPDKMVIASWNGWGRPKEIIQGAAIPDYWPTQAEGGTYNDSLLTRWSAVQPYWCYMGTTISPDNDSLRPDNETSFPVLYNGDNVTTCMQGRVGGLTYSQHNAVIRNDRSDATFNSTGFLPHIVDRYHGAQYRAYQYQTLSSFYDKTTINLVQITPGNSTTGSAGTSWLLGFGAGIIVDTTQKTEPRLYSHELGSIDLKTLTASQSVAGSKWWSVNGRLGVATTGGTGQFRLVKMASNSSSIISGVSIGWDEPLKTSASRWVDMAAAYYTDTPPEKVKYLQSRLMPLDSLLPVGWKGLVAETPDSQRVVAISRFHSDSTVARLQLTLPEGAPVFEAATTIRSGKSQVALKFDTLQTLGQTLAFYVTGESDTVFAEQVGDITVRLKGTGSIKLVYLSRADANVLDINGTKQSKTKAELKAGVDVALTSNWTVVRVSNWIDDDHTGPAVEVTSPQYYSDIQTECTGRAATSGAVAFANPQYQPDLVPVSDSGLIVKVMAKDRSGVTWIKLFLDWDSVGILTRDPCEMGRLYEFNLDKALFGEDSSIHALHAVACDVFGNTDTSVSVPFRVKISNLSAIEVVKPIVVGKVLSSSLANRNRMAVINTKVGLVDGKNSVKSMATLPFTQNVRNTVVDGPIKADLSPVSFDCNGKSYLIELSSKTQQVSLFQVSAKGRFLLGAATIKVMAKQWHGLKVFSNGGILEAAVDGVAVLEINQ